ncbi:MAG: type II toxin-antitoxin system BrnA family antitoxin [Pyrinomonadaceae bacterium]
MNQKPTISAEELDRRFDAGEDVSEYFDWTSARSIHEPPQRVNIDFPRWVVNRLDRESKRLGISRQSLVKMWIAERLEKVG